MSSAKIERRRFKAGSFWTSANPATSPAIPAE
jgi:hypothetical protein